MGAGFRMNSMHYKKQLSIEVTLPVNSLAFAA